MSVKSFWLIVLKIVGLLLLFSAVTVIPTIISLPFIFASGVQLDNLIIPGVGLVFSLMVFGLVVFMFIFRSGRVMEYLRLEDGFEDETIDLDFNRYTIISIATIVIGALMIVNGLPELVKSIIEYIGKSQFYGLDANFGWSIYYLLQCVLGYLLMTNHKWVVDFIERRTDDTGGGYDEAGEVLDSDEVR